MAAVLDAVFTKGLLEQVHKLCDDAEATGRGWLHGRLSR